MRERSQDPIYLQKPLVVFFAGVIHPLSYESLIGILRLYVCLMSLQQKPNKCKIFLKVKYYYYSISVRVVIFPIGSNEFLSSDIPYI